MCLWCSWVNDDYDVEGFFYPFFYYQLPSVVPNLVIAAGISPPSGILRTFIAFCTSPKDRKRWLARYGWRRSVSSSATSGRSRMPSGRNDPSSDHSASSRLSFTASFGFSKHSTSANRLKQAVSAGPTATTTTATNTTANSTKETAQAHSQSTGNLLNTTNM
jgi:hypothetical protein